MLDTIKQKQILEFSKTKNILSVIRNLLEIARFVKLSHICIKLVPSIRAQKKFYSRRN